MARAACWAVVGREATVTAQPAASAAMPRMAFRREKPDMANSF
jgi:hypothetical protein